MNIGQSQKQIQTVSLQRIQLADIMQMGIQELRDYVAEAIPDNPVLEIAEDAHSEECGSMLLSRLEWLSEGNGGRRCVYGRDTGSGGAETALPDEAREDNTLRRYILSQFPQRGLSPEIMKAVEFLLDRMDSNGFLDGDIYELAEVSGIRAEIMDRALTELRACDPAGVGAFSLSECLRLQLERYAGGRALAIKIAESYLDELSKGKTAKIAKALGTGLKETEEACELIRTLNPRPGNGFSGQSAVNYIVPDIIVRETDGRSEIIINDSFVPHLEINPYYLKLRRESDDTDVRAYLDEKLREAKLISDCIAQRRDTLKSCAELIVTQQESFFKSGTELKPFTMTRAAELMGVNESTVSRTVKGKYLQCRFGTFPLSRFFPGSVGGTTADMIKSALKAIIESETKALSDREIAEKLTEKGYTLSRRTVAKYRAELGIPGTQSR